MHMHMHSLFSGHRARAIVIAGVAAMMLGSGPAVHAGDYSNEQQEAIGNSVEMAESAEMPAPVADAASAVADEVLEEVVVAGDQDPPPAQIERQSVAVTEAVSVEDLAKTGDSDVAASLKRVVGVSVQGGRYAVVRGLAARYISNTLNGDLMASTNPYRRDVELDLFPADILAGIEIQKSFTADMPGDTTGGAIRIATRDPGAGFQGSASVKLGGAQGVWGSKLYSYKGGGTDWLGMDDGTRKLPSIIDSITRGGLQNPSAADSAAHAGALPNIYNLRQRSAGPEYGVALGMGNGFALSNGLLNFYGTFSYDQAAESRKQGQRADLRNVTATRFDRDSWGTELNGYLVVGLEGNGGWKLHSRTTLLRQTEDTAEFETGMDVDDNTPFDQTLLEYNERQFLAEQLQASLRLFDTHELAVRAGYSRTSSQTPDRRSYRYQNERFVSTSLERLYADLVEDAIDLGLDYNLSVWVADALEMKIKAGGLYDQRERSNDLVRLGIAPVAIDTTADLETLLTAENFQNGTYRLQGRSTATDNYGADQHTLAAYAQAETAFGPAVSLVTGLRFESFETRLDFPDSPSTPRATLKAHDLLPSLGINWRPLDDWQLRAAYARTASRPTISELSPSVFFDDRGRRFVGCTIQTVSGLRPCKTSSIDNFDLRAEYYLSRSDSISLAVFHKQIDAPLERGLINGATGYTYRNSKSARLTGVELDGQVGWNAGAGHDLTLGANVSFVDSSIRLDDDGRLIENLTSRKLQGQSPWLANLRITWEHPATRQSLTLSSTYHAARIDAAGGNGLQPLYEKGRQNVNLTWEKRLAGGAKFGLKLLNLTDDDSVYVQRDNADRQSVVERWRDGISGQVSFGYEF